MKTKNQRLTEVLFTIYLVALFGLGLYPSIAKAAEVLTKF